jgi:hypothetical protein
MNIAITYGDADARNLKTPLQTQLFRNYESVNNILYFQNTENKTCSALRVVFK